MSNYILPFKVDVITYPCPNLNDGLANQLVKVTQIITSYETDNIKQALFFNSLRPRQDGRHFADDIFSRIFLNENVLISIKISLKFVPKGPINNIPALVQIMAWLPPGDKPLSEPVMVRLLTHICLTRPQRVNNHWFPSHESY